MSIARLSVGLVSKSEQVSSSDTLFCLYHDYPNINPSTSFVVVGDYGQV